MLGTVAHRLTQVELHNFKRFRHLVLPLHKLTLLSGLNSMGKSTLIQSLLLLRQTYERDALCNGIFLNGVYTNIGVGQDILFEDAEEPVITIRLIRKSTEITWEYQYEADTDYLKCLSTPLNLTDSTIIEKTNLFSKDFEYLCAERLPPQLSYPKSYYDVRTRQHLGIHGEYTVHYLSEMRGQRVENVHILHPEDQTPTLLAQTEQWMNEISPGTRLNFEDYGHANALGLLVRQQNNSYFSATNIGFGLTYILPVIVALLKAPRGGLVILENPEAHLHPAGQRKIGEMIARAAVGGVQILLETHSDHVLNGIRLSVKRGILPPEDTALYYLCANSAGKYFENPRILADGRLSFWPKGFFDEWDKAIDEMF